MIEFRLDIAGRQQTVVADAHKSSRKHVEQEAADEFDGIDGQGLGFVGVGVIPDLELDATVVETKQPVIGDGDPMGVVPEVSEDMFRPAEWAFGVNYPVGAVEAIEELSPHGGLDQFGGATAEFQFPLVVGLGQCIKKLSAKQPPKHLDREKEGLSR